MTFQHENNRIFAKDENECTIAEVTFPAISKNTVCINHTFVDESLRGVGVASELIKAVIKELQSKNLKAVITCSYAVKWFKKHPECSKLLFSSRGE